jgi:CRISPR-associated protein Cas2
MRRNGSRHHQTLHRYVVVYDVSDDRRRERVADALCNYGIRVGLSVFEVNLTAAEAARLRARAEDLIAPSTDRVHLYRLCMTCEAASQRVGSPWRERTETVALI